MGESVSRLVKEWILKSFSCFMNHQHWGEKNVISDLLVEYKPNKPLRSLGSSQLVLPQVKSKSF